MLLFGRRLDFEMYLSVGFTLLSMTSVTGARILLPRFHTAHPTEAETGDHLETKSYTKKALLTEF